MNPLIARLCADGNVANNHALPTPPAPPLPSQLRVTAYDRDYIAAHMHHFNSNPDLFAYDRTPLPDEWLEPVPSGAFVRVFVINEWTTVRALHLVTGQRVGEPVIDTWRGYTEPTAD